MKNIARENLEIQDREIERSREIFKPSPIREFHVPKYLRDKIIKTLEISKQTGTGFSGPQVLKHAAKVMADQVSGTARWLDHWGSVEISGKTCLASEPYDLTSAHLRSILAFAETFELEATVSSNSWHFPGRTVRVVFVPKFETKGGIDDSEENHHGDG